MESYQVRVEKHWGGKNYNVSLVSWERNGSGMTSNRAFDAVSYTHLRAHET